MSFADSISGPGIMLGTGSMYERLRRLPTVDLDPHLAHATLFYDQLASTILRETYLEYLDVARTLKLPMLVTAGTWRANEERIAASRFDGRLVNQEHIAWLREICDTASSSDHRNTTYLSGVLGCKGDAYEPTQSLSYEDAYEFHAFQANALAESEIDLLIAMTLPALSEARGLARAMQLTGLPYLLSFVVLEEGTLLDGTSLSDAIERIDAERARPPLGYLINCVHPTVLDSALEKSRPKTAARILGLKANTSQKRPRELAATEELITEEPETFASKMVELQQKYSLKILAGCCGTGTEHMAAIASQYRDSVGAKETP